MPPDYRFNLTVLVRDLMNSTELRQQFNRRPERVMQDYGLDDAERCILYTMDPATIQNHVFPPVGAQVGGYDIPNGEFSPSGPNCIPDPGVAMPQYPVPRPALFRVRPRRITPVDLIAVDVGGVVTRYFEINVFGQSFSRNPIPAITITHQTTGAVLNLDSRHLFGSMRCSQLNVMVIAPAMNAASAGTYDIQVTNCPGPNPHVVGNTLELVLAP